MSTTTNTHPAPLLDPARFDGLSLDECVALIVAEGQAEAEAAAEYEDEDEDDAYRFDPRPDLT